MSRHRPDDLGHLRAYWPAYLALAALVAGCGWLLHWIGA